MIFLNVLKIHYHVSILFVPNVHGNVCPEIFVFSSRVENPVTRGDLGNLRITGEGVDQPLGYRAGMA